MTVIQESCAKNSIIEIACQHCIMSNASFHDAVLKYNECKAAYEQYRSFNNLFVPRPPDKICKISVLPVVLYWVDTFFTSGDK
jgi:hypothetical protein